MTTSELGSLESSPPSDPAGAPSSFLDAEGVLHQSILDPNGRLAQLRYADRPALSFDYGPGGLLLSETLHDASGSPIARTSFSYDPLGRLARRRTVRLSSREVLADYAWDYDPAGQVSALRLQHLAADFSFSSDSLGRLAAQSSPGNSSGSSAPPFSTSFGPPPSGNQSDPGPLASASPRLLLPLPPLSASFDYHPDGSRRRVLRNGIPTDFSYDSAGRLLSQSSPLATVSHLYDPWGHEISRTTTPSSGSSFSESFAYNAFHLLSAYSNSLTGSSFQYLHWPTAERYAKTDLASGRQELYLPRGADVAGDYRRTAPDQAPAWTATYIQGPGIDDKKARVSSTGLRRHYLGDQVGTLGVVLDDTGAAAETVVRDAWGNLLAGSSSERYGFAQREHDSESGLVYMRYRMYDPRAGRFTQPDPLRFNRPFKNYLYARNDPLSFTDPLGLDDTPESKARMLRHFALWYGEAGLVLLEAFRESGGTLTLKNMWWGKSSVGIRHITIDMDDEGEAADYLMDALVKAIGQLGVEQKLKVAAALGLESTAQLNLATVKSIAQETRKVLESAQIGAAIASPGAALALGVEQLAQGDYLGAALTFAGTRALRGGRGGSKEVGGTARAQEAIERHHLLPKEFKPFFERAGLDIEEYVIDLSRAQHRLKPGGLHTGKESWNKAWRQFFEKSQDRSKMEILEQLSKMRKDFGLE